MALELLGGALASAVFLATFDRLASPDIWDYFRGRELNEKLLKKLHIMLLSLNAVLDDAEEKQIRKVNVRKWLDDVKDAAFDAEDLLDEIHIQVSRSRGNAAPAPAPKSGTKRSLDKVRHFFHASRTSFDKEIEPRMQDIIDNLEDLVIQKDILGLRESGGSAVGSVSHKPPSTSLPSEPVIYGRDDDKETIFNWLMHDTENDNRQLSIISIVGMGGMGKTTLAQHLYSDPRVEDKFDIKAWVCVSDAELDLLKVTRTILEEITIDTDESIELNMLQVKLKEKLMGKRFLLVLDDVWNEDRMQWESLRAPFNGAAQGSIILVTTRSTKVASIMRSHTIHQLEQLQEEHCWQLFSKHAFHDENSLFNPDFKEVGMQIFKKCKGLPLALKAIGSLLNRKSSSLAWEKILRSEIWEVLDANSNLVPALMLSYQHLPSNLKRCFAYCSLFPKDYEFEKEELVLLWMAQDYLKCPQQGKSLEEVGREYFDDLLSRSFFKLSSRDPSRFVMHDLLDDLAKVMSGNFVCRMEDEEAQNISKMTRHFSFVRSRFEASERFDVLDNANKLRTFLPLRRNANPQFLDPDQMSDILVHGLVSKFKFIRALSFSGYAIEELPDSVCNLTHLRYLDLSCTHIKKLPDSICLLYNLEILKLKDCRNLKELPSNLHKLSSLRYLDFSGTKVREMPMHLGKLNNLQVLSSFYVGKGKESNIQELGELNLHGALSICDLQYIVNPLDALAANLKNKIHLVKLDLEWCANDDDSQKEREVLEKLQPSKHLMELSILNYGGRRFPDWLGDNSLLNMVSLTLGYCKNCVSLPPFGLLSSLKQLSVIGLHGLVVIGDEFYGNRSSSTSTVPFTSLETIVFQDMEELEIWECNTVGGVFPRLQELYVKNCPKLKVHLPEKLPSLKILNINDCRELVTCLPWAPAIQELDLYDCGKLQFGYHPSTLQRLSIDGCCIPIHNCYHFLVELKIISSCESMKIFPLDIFPKLRSLYLLRCQHLEMITQEEHCHDLTDMRINMCPKFLSFPKGGLSAPRLQRLDIAGLENIRLLPECMPNLLPSLHKLIIDDCPQLESFSDGGLPPNLEYLTLGNCCKLLMASLKQALATNTSLLRLSINGMDHVESFPDEGLLPHSLTFLEISDCINLKELDYRGLCHLPSLTKLSLFNCPGLQCLPEEPLPASISTLSIKGMCPLKRLRYKSPQDWPKISHINWIYIEAENLFNEICQKPFGSLEHSKLSSMKCERIMTSGFAGSTNSEKEKEGMPKLPPYTYNLELTSCVYGRQKEKDQVVDLLLSMSDSDDDITNTNIPVLGIVGPGGIGKTTLTRVVYEDHSVKALFDLRVWLTFPSYQHDAGTLARMMLGVLKVEFDQDGVLQDLIPLLQKSFTGRRLLLVLDCCCVVHQWEILQACFECAARGSAIILTTRTTEAALQMSADHVLHLDFLSMEHCWSLFSEHCFGNQRPDCSPQLEAVRRKILNKCGGVPLACKMLGGLLHKKEYKEWVDIWRSTEWDWTDVNLPMPFVRLCYRGLPVLLQPCVTRLSLIPKGYEFQKEQVVHLWISNGLIQREYSETMKEKLGYEYFDFLVARSFLIRSHSGSSTYFTMHDMVHDLAKWQSGFYRNGDIIDTSRLISDMQYLERTPSELHGSRTEDDISLKNNTDITNSSHGHEAQAREAEVPIPIDANAAVQDTFDFRTSFERRKISNVVQLVSLPSTLQSLRIEGCHSLKSLQDVLMNKCTNLVELYIIDCFSLKHLTEEKYPSSLRTLYIHKCRKLEFLLPDLNRPNFEFLEHLFIGSSCESLKSLTLNLFPKLKLLCIWECPNLESLSIEESQSNSLSLESLDIRDCSNLVSFPAKGLLSPCLRSLSVSNCKNLRSLPNDMTTLTSLQSLFMNGCPELESLPEGGLPSCLKLLSIGFCDKLIPQKEWNLKALHCLHRFEIESGCMGVKSFPEKDLFPVNLTSLYISKLPSLEVLNYSGLQQLTALESLEINSCEKLSYLPEFLPSSLTSLSIKESPMLTQKLLNPVGADRFKIAHISNIRIDDRVFSR